MYATFRRQDRTQVNTEARALKIFRPGQTRAIVLEATIALCIKGPERVLAPDEVAAVQVAAAQSPAVARLADLFARHEVLRTFNKDRDQRTAMKEFAEQIEKLESIEREYWACRFGQIHIRAAGPLLHQDGTAARFHLDMCAALYKSLGTATSKAQWIRQTSASHREWVTWYEEQKRIGKPGALRFPY